MIIDLWAILHTPSSVVTALNIGRYIRTLCQHSVKHQMKKMFLTIFLK